MRALGRVVDRVDDTNRIVATACCVLVDRFLEEQTPANLQDAQDLIRHGLQDTRRLIQVQRGRDHKRGAHFEARGERSQGLLRGLGEHIDVLDSRKTLLERRRHILRASADGLAWLALAHAPASVPNLFRPQTHDLPPERGLIGHVLVQQAAHSTGRFLVLENDLTRCLGLGDLTIVSLAALDLPPISVEIKTKVAELAEGGEAELELSMVEIDDPRAIEVLDDFNSALGLSDRRSVDASVGQTRQLREFFEQAQFVIRHHREGAPPLGPVESNWGVVRRVLARAVPGSPALDMAEEGVWFAAVFATNDSDLLFNDIEQVQRDAVRLIPRYGEERLEIVHSKGLEDVDTTSALTMPVAVWRLPLGQRARVLNGDLILFGFLETRAVQRRAQRMGIAAEVSSEKWTFSKNSTDRLLTEASLLRARLDILFGSLRLGSLLERIDESLQRANPGTT